MKRLFLTAALFLSAVTLPAHSQADPRPFAEFDREVQTQPAGFAGDKGRLSLFFDRERRRLRGRFEAELLEYAGGDAEKCYWLSIFLTAPSYLHGDAPLPQLALRLQQRGLDLLRGKSDEDGRGLSVSLNVVAAVLSAQLNLHERASSYKNAAEDLLSREPHLDAYFPGMDAEELKLYDSIASEHTNHRFRPPPEDKPLARVSSGVLNGRAKKLPAPNPPSMGVVRVETEVKVEVVVDESGKVIWAQAVSGHPLLRESAVQAARRAEFDPLLLSGRPIRFQGYLVYKFSRNR